MQILVVFCHPAGESFQRTILDALSARLEADGHAVRVLDLYGAFQCYTKGLHT